jgi:hypothetical protein
MAVMSNQPATLFLIETVQQEELGISTVISERL